MRRVLALAAVLFALRAAPAPAADLPCNPAATSAAYAPARGTHGMLLFEDLWPDAADYDFNDLALAYHFTLVHDAAGRAVSLQASLGVLALGSGLPSGLYLHLPVPRAAAREVLLQVGDAQVSVAPVEGEPELVLPLAEDVRRLFGGTPGMLHTVQGQGTVASQALTLRVAFAEPVALDAAGAPFDLFIARSGAYGHQVHLPQYAGTARMDRALFGTGADGSTDARHFVTRRGMPYVLHVPRRVAWPTERVPIQQAYPSITDFAASGGARAADWYLAPVAAATWPLAGAVVLPAPDAGFAAQQTRCRPAASCVEVEGLQWCSNPGACGQSCEDVCRALGRGPPVDDATWFEAQRTPERCGALAQALGLGPEVFVGPYTTACLEDAFGAGASDGRLVGPLYCSTHPACPAAHRTAMDQAGAACAEGRRSICPCQ